MDWDRTESETINDRKPRRRWFVLVLAAVAGFMGSGGAISGGTIVTVLVGLFVAVFFIALAYSMVTEPSAFEPELGATGSYADNAAAPVATEAVYGSS
jgi:hypothetical protein